MINKGMFSKNNDNTMVYHAIYKMYEYVVVSIHMLVIYSLIYNAVPTGDTFQPSNIALNGIQLFRFCREKVWF